MTPRYTLNVYKAGDKASILLDGKRRTGTYSLPTARRYCAWLNDGCPKTKNLR